jgi:hypothetical protein
MYKYILSIIKSNLFETLMYDCATLKQPIYIIIEKHKENLTDKVIKKFIFNKIEKYENEIRLPFVVNEKFYNRIESRKKINLTLNKMDVKQLIKLISSLNEDLSDCEKLNKIWISRILNKINKEDNIEIKLIK